MGTHEEDIPVINSDGKLGASILAFNKYHRRFFTVDRESGDACT